jgi:threonine/homoserine/homoserine lactone efflux protein
MSIEVWISFVLASMMLCFTPGPTVFLVMGQSLHHGKKSVIPLVTVVLSGDVIAMGLSFLAVSVLSASFYSFFSGYLRSKIKSVKFQKAFNKISGSMLIGAGAVTATLHKSG